MNSWVLAESVICKVPPLLPPNIVSAHGGTPCPAVLDWYTVPPFPLVSTRLQSCHMHAPIHEVASVVSANLLSILHHTTGLQIFPAA